jgi:hypothetical protein
MGAPKDMEWYGIHLMFRLDKYAEGKAWLERSIALGNGDAYLPLSTYYATIQLDVKKIIESLRAGAKMGSVACLIQLRLTYLYAFYGQDEDEKYSMCFRKLREKIDDLDPPKPIENFDAICPPKPIKPWDGKR